MVGATSSAVSPNGGVAAGLQQPQTTIEPPGGPFIRHSQPGRRPIYNTSGLSFLASGNIVTQPVVAVPGYFRGFRMTFTTTGGSAGSGQTLNPDYPYSIASLVTLKDAFGTPIIVAPGYEAFNLIPLYGGQLGIQGTRFVANLPSYSASTGATSTGNFSFSTYLPFEFAKAYGCISGANASLLPTLTMNIANSAALTSGGTAFSGNALQVQCDADFYWLPEGVAVEPPGLGTTMQWIYQQCNPTFSNGSTTTVQLPRLGGYIAALILEIRDGGNNNVRVDNWPTGNNRLRIIVDGVPLIDSTMAEIYDDMAIQFGVGDGSSAAGTVTRPTGTICITRRTSLNQTDMGLFDTGESYLSTNPGTLIEIQGSPWASAGTGPYTLNVLAAQVVPAGTLIQGLPEV
jgi:hypothetical protein